MKNPMDDLVRPLTDVWVWDDHSESWVPAKTKEVLFTADQMREYAKKAVEAEREACADLVESFGRTWMIDSRQAESFAELIRTHRR